MKTVAVYTNEKKDSNLNVTERVVSFLEGKCRVALSADFSSFDEMCAVSDALIVLGGDGTILRVARVASSFDLPILGINLGKIGYLAEVDPDKIEECLTRFVDGSYKIEERFMIKAEIYRGGEKISTYNALNDMVISSSSFKRLISMDLYVSDDFITSYDADGVVVATPTGSTAYSLSAGGPITDSSMELMLVTPICAHTLSSRPLIIPSDKEITLTINKSHERISTLIVDGQESQLLELDDKVVISAAECKTKLIRVNGMSFYEILRKKISN